MSQILSLALFTTLLTIAHAADTLTPFTEENHDKWKDFPQKANDYRRFFIKPIYCRQEDEFYNNFIKPINKNHKFTVQNQETGKHKRTYESKDKSMIITTEPKINSKGETRSQAVFTDLNKPELSWICFNASIDLRPKHKPMQLWLMSTGKCRKSLQTPPPAKRRRKDDKPHGSTVDKSTQTSSDSSSNSSSKTSSSKTTSSKTTSSSKQIEYSFIILSGFILITFYQIM